MKNKKRAKQLLHIVKRHFHLQPLIKQAMMASYQNRHTAGERERVGIQFLRTIATTSIKKLRPIRR